MSGYSKKRRVSDSEGSDPDVAKRSKKVKSASAGAVPDGKDGDGNPYWELSAKRRAGVSQFKGASFINLREYYEKDGKTLPGKKGISLSVDQYTALLKAIPGINAALRDLGQLVDVPETSTALVPTKKKTKKDGTKSDKANIEATSDEDDE